ncbi:MAG: copper resistance protein CopC, partial [Actinomycetota bacterium]|nr:copper resistance protein CopC [Actinomycetota bacterium]
LAAVCVGLAPRPAFAHAALLASEPLDGSTVETAPTAVRLSFSEGPEPSLSSIRVVDETGAVHQGGPVQPAPGGGHTLEVPLRPLGQGSYTVVWRTVSRVDGHPTAGVLTFGVGVAPHATGASAAPATSPPWTELVGRGALIAGLVGLLGAACAASAGFGATAGGALAVACWVASVLGLVFLADGQRRNSSATFGELWATPTGRYLAWRAVAILAAGMALALARRLSGPARRVAMGMVAGATAAAMAVEVVAGHAAGAASWPWLVVLAQWAHFAAAGAWLGGLAALLLGTRGAPSDAKATAVARFSRLALAALVAVVVTGTVRALGEVSSWDDLTATGYGRAVLVKILLVVAIVGLAAVNRRVGVRAAARNLSPLRRVSTAEMVLAAGALAAAAALASLAPPVDASATAAPGLTVSGADAATAVRAMLAVRPATPGLNAFELRIDDYDTGDPVRADAASLRFLAVDDPGLPPTTSALRAAGPGRWTASGPNLAVDGRWQVTVLARRGAESIVVPLAVEVRGPPQFLSVQALAGEPVKYTVELATGGYARIWADPERAGPSVIHAAFFDRNGDLRPAERVVVTTAPAGQESRQHGTSPAGLGEFTAGVTLPAGRTTVAVVARTPDGTRMRASVDLDVGE